MSLFGSYTIGEAIKNGFSFFYTKCFFPKARLIRRPVYIRGKKHLKYSEGFTTGYGCRFDLGGNGKTLILGSNCKLNDRVHIVAHESVLVGNDVLMASNIFISDTSHGRYGQDDPQTVPDKRPLITSPVRIGDRVWIGEGACILPGVTLGSGCIVGSNAVVTKSFPENTIIGGVPAKILKTWDPLMHRWADA